MKQYDRALLRRKVTEMVDSYINSIPRNSEVMTDNEFEFPLILMAYVAKGSNGVVYTSATVKVVEEYESQNSFNTSHLLTKDHCKVMNDMKNDVSRCLDAIAEKKKLHATKLHRQFGGKE